MIPIAVPGLGQKLRLLAELADLGGWPGLAARFGRAPQTLRYWGHGNADRPPDMLPSEHLATLRSVLAEAMGEDIASTRIDELLSAPPRALEHALLGRSGQSLRDMIEVNRPGFTGE